MLDQPTGSSLKATTLKISPNDPIPSQMCPNELLEPHMVFCVHI